MQMELYNSSLVGPALGVTTGLCVHFYIKHRKFSTFLLLLGFTLVTVSTLSINHCLNLISLDIADLETPFDFLCTEYTADIEAIAYILIAVGMGKMFEELRNNA